MKNLKNRYIIFVLFCSCILLGSCKKFINEGPIDAPTTANFWSDEIAANTGLAGAYGLLRTSLTNKELYFVFGDLVANEFSSYNGNQDYNKLNPDNLWNFAYTSYSGVALNNWTDFYQTITQCNLIINKVPGIPANKFTDDPVSTKNQILGEAYFIRAYCYYYITQVWGSPVIVTQVFAQPITAPPIARSTDEAGFAQVVSDLKMSASLLKYGNTDPSTIAVRANKGSAFALLSKVYMWQKQYQLASNAADSVIRNGNYVLESSTGFSNIFKGHDPESIFEMNMLYSGLSNEATSGKDGFFSIFLTTPFVVSKTGSWTVNTNLIANLYDTTSKSTDIRVNATFYNRLTTPLMVKYSNVVYQGAQTTATSYVNNNLVLLRLADVYLVKAEASYQLSNNATAITNLNYVRQRAGIKPDSLSDPHILYTIMDERGRELFGEGQWYFDLFRSGLIDDPNYQNSILGYLPQRVNGGGCHWPLDMTTLLPQDPLLIQNPWWAKQLQ